MAKKKTEEAPEGILETAAKTIGTAAGKIAAAVGVTAEKKPAKVKIPKLAPKNKTRMPRKQKKALKKTGK
jgi:hypothetical protein